MTARRNTEITMYRIPIFVHMNDIRNIAIMIVGAFMTLLSPIKDFMLGMMILFGVNFIFGLLAARYSGENWSWKKAGMFFICCMVFFVTVAALFIVGHYMHVEDQAVVCVKYVCFAAIYMFGTNILRNCKSILPEASPWRKLIDLLYDVLTVKFAEKLKAIKKRQRQ